MSLKLSRAEIIEGVLELTQNLTIARADAGASLVFGVPPSAMNAQPLSK